jgi:hypothetical protein
MGSNEFLGMRADFQCDRPSRGKKRALTEIAARLVKNADVMTATTARDKMANVPFEHHRDQADNDPRAHCALA